MDTRHCRVLDHHVTGVGPRGGTVVVVHAIMVVLVLVVVLVMAIRAIGNHAHGAVIKAVGCAPR